MRLHFLVDHKFVLFVAVQAVEVEIGASAPFGIVVGAEVAVWFGTVAVYEQSERN